MPLIPHEVTNFDEALREQIMKGEGFEGKVYYNTGDTPTIGYGLALYAKHSGAKVTTAFNDITNANTNVSISQADNVLFNQIETAMQASPRNNAMINNLVNQLSLDLGTETTGQSVFNNTIGRYETAVENRLGSALYTTLENSNEMIALVDIAYNGGAGLIGPGLRHALEHENRAEAWFQIRYDSNGGQSRVDFGKGIANRRVAESDVFSLYNENPSAEEMKDVIRMARFHTTKIANEESAFPVTSNSPSANPYAGDNSILDQIQVAKDYLILNFGENVTIDGKLIVGNDSVNDNSANRGNISIDDTQLKGTNDNDLIFGEKGDDTLRGYAGDDILYGGQGQDKLYGGSGNDIYKANTGDTINDSDNSGRIYFDATLLTGLKHKVSEGVYEDAMFTYTEENQNLTIAQKEDPTKSITVENWDSNSKEALGIELSETKVNEVENTNEGQNSILPESINNYLEQFGGTNNENNNNINID